MFYFLWKIIAGMTHAFCWQEACPVTQTKVAKTEKSQSTGPNLITHKPSSFLYLPPDSWWKGHCSFQPAPKTDRHPFNGLFP